MLQDEDLMPYGKFRGTKMANVPASYLLWLADELKKTALNKRTLQNKSLLKYIEENMDVLKKENRNDREN
jgi:hypothetical protein